MKRKPSEMIKQRWRRILIVALLDIICIAVSFFLGLWIRYEFSLLAIPADYKAVYCTVIFPWVGLCLVVYAAFGLYKSIWSFVGIDELFRILMAYLCLGVACVAVSMLAPIQMPISFYVLGMLFSLVGTVGLRFSYRFLRQLLMEFRNRRGTTGTAQNVMIIGAGEAGRAETADRLPARRRRRRRRPAHRLVGEQGDSIHGAMDAAKIRRRVCARSAVPHHVAG